MSDNIVLKVNSGGDTLAADEISSVKYTRSKITIGADGADDGDLSSSNGLPISIDPKTALVGTGIINVTTTAVQLPSWTAARGIIVKALSANGGKVYVGKDSGVTTTTGLELAPGYSESFFLTNSNLIWCISDIIDQKVSYLVV